MFSALDTDEFRRMVIENQTKLEKISNNVKNIDLKNIEIPDLIKIIQSIKDEVGC